MVRHVVLFKFKDEVDAAAREAFVHSLRALQTEVPEVRRLQVGLNFAEAARAHDVALIVDLDDRAALAAYADHPKHIPVKQRAAEICAAMPVVDYEV